MSKSYRKIHEDPKALEAHVKKIKARGGKTVVVGNVVSYRFEKGGEVGVLTVPEMKKLSLKIANEYNKLQKGDFKEDEFKKYEQLVDKTGIPRHKAKEIQFVVLKTNGNFKPIDIYKYW